MEIQCQGPLVGTAEKAITRLLSKSSTINFPYSFPMTAAVGGSKLWLCEGLLFV